MKIKKSLALILALVMILAMIPATAFATTSDTTGTTFSGKTLNVVCEDQDGNNLQKKVSIGISQSPFSNDISDLQPDDKDLAIDVNGVAYVYTETSYNKKYADYYLEYFSGKNNGIYFGHGWSSPAKLTDESLADMNISFVYKVATIPVNCYTGTALDASKIDTVKVPVQVVGNSGKFKVKSTEIINTLKSEGYNVVSNSQGLSIYGLAVEYWPKHYALSIQALKNESAEMQLSNLISLEALVTKATAATFTVTYNSDGGATAPTDSKKYTAGSNVTLPTAITKEGYTFKGWNDGTSTYAAGTQYAMPANNVSFTAVWDAKTDTPYTVEYYTMDTNGQYPASPTQVENLTGTTDTTANVTTAAPTGFTLDRSSVTSGKIIANGSLVLTVKYMRNSHVVTYTLNGNKLDTLGSTQYFSSNVQLAAVPDPTLIPQGYTFGGWISSEATINQDYFTMPDRDVNFTANLIANTDTKYTVNYYTMDTNGRYPKTPDTTLVKSGETGKTGTADVAAVPTGFTLDGKSITSGTIKGDGTLILTVKYSRNQYTLKYSFNGDSVVNKMVYFGTPEKVLMDVTWPFIPVGYHFTGWKTTDVTVDSNGNFNMPAANVTFTGNKEINVYTINFNLNGGTSAAIPSQQVNYNGKVQKPADPTREGYTFVGWVLSDVDLGILGTVDLGDFIKHLYNYEKTPVLTNFELKAVWTENMKLAIDSGSGIYDGKAHQIQISEAPKGAQIFYSLDGKKWDQKPITRTDVSSTDVYYLVKKAGYTATTGNVKLTITARPVTITIDNATKIYGSEDPAFTGTVGNCINDTDLGTVNYVRTNQDKNVGTYEGVIDATYTENSNYLVTVNKGDLTITAKDATVETGSASQVYNGTALTDNTVTLGGIIEGDKITATAIGTITNVGTTENTVQILGDETLLKNYNFMVTEGALEITKAKITITAGSASKTYDGTALTTGGAITGETNLAAGDKLTRLETIGTITNVGTTTNAINMETIQITRGEDIVTENYEITPVDGMLTITSSGGGHHRTTTTTTTITEPEVPLAGTPELNKVDHFNYMNGYQDGTIKPLNNITREEVASIFYRMLTDDSRKIFDTQNQDFSDINADRWSVGAIATLANAGIITGNSDGTFAATKPITRAEFAVVASRFDTLEENTDGITFSDISGNWAEKYIKSAVKKGWITGYSDGTFKPNQYITRAEAMALINRVLDRRVEATGLVDGYKTFSDVKPTDWYYYQVIEATNNHDYAQRNSMSDTEIWTKIKEDKTWTK